MIRLARSLAPLAVAGLIVATVSPAVAHSPDPTLAWPLFGQNQALQYRWLAGEAPPPKMQAAVNAAAADANASRGSRAPTLALAATGASTVEYGLNVWCGANGLACADGTNAPDSFRVAFREHGHRFDWGVLQWCQLMAPMADGCFDAENIALDEFGHTFTLGHHVNFADERDYLDAVVQTVSRARPRVGWNAHAFGRCDVATLQVRYDMQTWQAKYSTCLDLQVRASLVVSQASIQPRTTVVFTASLSVTDLPAYGRLGGNPISGRVVVLQRRPPGTATWTSIGSMAPAAATGTYTMSWSPTATYEYRASLAKPNDEGLRSAASAPVRVTVTTCTGGPCPQGVPAAQVHPTDGR